MSQCRDDVSGGGAALLGSGAQDVVGNHLVIEGLRRKDRSSDDAVNLSRARNENPAVFDSASEPITEFAVSLASRCRSL